LRGLCAILQDASEFAVVGSSHSSSHAARDSAIKRAEAVLLDAESASGGIASWAVGSTGPLGVVILKDHRESAWAAIASACELPALRGLSVINKDCSSARLYEAIRLACSGAFTCDLGGIRGVLSNIASMADRGSPPPEALSPRESEVLDLVAEGHSNKAIGIALRLSEGTVKAHVSHIMAKLHLANRSQVVAYAIATAMVSSSASGNRP
jgi:DNA-binding NarL/FixJ family response regulator